MSAGLASHISCCDIWMVGSEFGISHSDGVDLSGFVAAVQAAGAAGGEMWSSDDAVWGNVFFFLRLVLNQSRSLTTSSLSTVADHVHLVITTSCHLGIYYLQCVSKSSDHFTFIEYDSEFTGLRLRDDS